MATQESAEIAQLAGKPVPPLERPQISFIVWRWLGTVWTVHGPFPNKAAAYSAAAEALRMQEAAGKKGYTYEVVPGRALR